MIAWHEKHINGSLACKPGLYAWKPLLKVSAFSVMLYRYHDIAMKMPARERIV